MEEISEFQIKKAALRFLKSYYKFRPRTGETSTAIDMTTGDGLVADGFLTFPTDTKGNTFTSTLEATSFTSRNEVLFENLDTDLTWDGLAFSSLITSFIVVSIFVFSRPWMIGWGTLGTASFVCILLGFFIVLYYILFKNIHRYRYIYAIEQFKQYHADEQWIALGEDVFESSLDPYMDEMKTQCIYNGFGLILVNGEQECQMVITPSREEVIKKRRRKKKFLTSASIPLPTSLRGGQKVRSWFSKIFRNKYMNFGSLMRFRKSHFLQMGLTSLGLFLIGTIFYRHFHDGPIWYVNEADYQRQLVEMELKKNIRVYQVDSTDAPFIRPFGEAPVSYLGKVPDGLIREKTPLDLGWVGVDQIPSGKTEVAISTDQDRYMLYECERLFNLSGKKYVVRDGYYKDINYAKKRLSYLNHYGFKANMVWKRCFSKTDNSYLVFIDEIYNAKADAKQMLSTFNTKIKDHNLVKADPGITTIKH